MKSRLFLFLTFALGTTALPRPQFDFPTTAPSAGGTGPFAPAHNTTDPTLPNHTLYLPSTVPATARLPVLIWGNGACLADGSAFSLLLHEVASHGVFVIANGAPGGKGTTNSGMLKEAVDWVVDKQQRAAEYPFLESARIAVAGQSCGGVEAITVANDTRIGALGVFNSGLLTEAESKTVVSAIKGKPVFYFLGGSTDIAYANGERDYSLLPPGTPSWKGNLDVGHQGTYWETDGGKFGVAAVKFFDWVLRGNATAASFFTGEEAKQSGWKVDSKDLAGIKAVPI